MRRPLLVSDDDYVRLRVDGLVCFCPACTHYPLAYAGSNGAGLRIALCRAGCGTLFTVHRDKEGNLTALERIAFDGRKPRIYRISLDKEQP